MKIKEVRRKGKYLETFCSVDDTWTVYEFNGEKYCWSHATAAFDNTCDKEACLYSDIVEEA
ncbi:MAG: hypothetical protein HWQ36_26305 [Nostoc sp. NMS2]|uniref:hypothetical protein n=1 Tax=Nostoc sp. NMS2 TaxID=2815389 RepID=UPI0025EA608A|nr:hypothetical protein [Nostoc sp. NMS2]MBN3993901.1 hypothetical protein [Nostoc sp. NMS2]